MGVVDMNNMIFSHVSAMALPGYLPTFGRVGSKRVDH